MTIVVLHIEQNKNTVKALPQHQCFCPQALNPPKVVADKPRSQCVPRLDKPGELSRQAGGIGGVMSNKNTLNKNIWLWTQRAAMAVFLLAFLARLARLPFAPTLMICGVASFAAVFLVGLLVKLLHRWKWISELPWDDKPSPVIDPVLAGRPPIAEPAPIAIGRNPVPASATRLRAERQLAVTWSTSQALWPTTYSLARQY
jgi:hypothetical protein